MKKVVALLLAVLMLAGFAACGKKEAAAPAAPATDTKSETKTEAKSELPFAGTTLRVILATHDWTKAVEKKLPEFEAATGMKVEYEVYPEGQLSDKLNVELGSGGQYIDVFMCRPLQEVQQFIQNGFLAEVSDLLADPEYQKDDFIPAALNGYARNGANDGKFYGVPLVTERQVLMYRKDLFEAKGLKVPTNLEEFEECAKALHDPANGVVGVALRGKPNPAVTQFAAYLYGFGGDFIDFANNKAIINSPEAVKAFEYYGGLLRNYGPTDAVNMHWNECAALFSTGGWASSSTGASTASPPSPTSGTPGRCTCPGCGPMSTTSKHTGLWTSSATRTSSPGSRGSASTRRPGSGSSGRPGPGTCSPWRSITTGSRCIKASSPGGTRPRWAPIGTCWVS